jgi:hypothetical protein
MLEAFILLGNDMEDGAERPSAEDERIVAVPGS